MDVKKLLSEMSLKEKLGQLTQLNAVFFNPNNDADITGPTAKMNITEVTRKENGRLHSGKIS